MVSAHQMQPQWLDKATKPVTEGKLDASPAPLQLLDVLQQYCMASGLDYRRLDGSTKSEERLKIVKEFNSTQDVNICLVSTM